MIYIIAIKPTNLAQLDMASCRVIRLHRLTFDGIRDATGEIREGRAAWRLKGEFYTEGGGACG